MLVLGTMVIEHSAYDLCLEVQTIGGMIQFARHHKQIVITYSDGVFRV
jgi:hypothetical protein